MSVLNGQFADFEIVVSNNGLPEHTRNLRERTRDPRIRWVEQSQDLDLLGNFLASASLARGRYVSVLHDDDWLHPDYLARLIPPLEAHPEAVLAFTDPWHVGVNGEIDSDTTDYFTRVRGLDELAPGFHRPFHELVLRESIPFPGCIFRRDALSPADFPREVGPAYDIWATHLLARTDGAAYFSSDRLVYYTVHEDREFAEDPVPYFESAVYCEQRMLDDAVMAPKQTDISRRLAARQRWLGVCLLRRGARKAARTHLADALRLRPTLKGLVGWGASWLLPRSLLTRL